MSENSPRYDTFVGINFHCQDNFEYLADVLVSIIIKISRENNLTNESQIHDIRGNALKLIALRFFDGVTTDF